MKMLMKSLRISGLVKQLLVVVQPDVGLPGLVGHAVAVLVDVELAVTLLLHGVDRAGGDVGDRVGLRVVLQGGGPFEGRRDAEGTDRAVLRRHRELLDGVPGCVDLLGVEHRVAVGGGDLVVLDRDVAFVELLETLLGALVEGAVLLADQEEGERAGGHRARGADREVVARRVGGLHDRRADDLRDRLFLGRAGAVAVVRERRLGRQDDRVDHEQHEHEQAGHQVLERQGPLGGVGGQQDRGDRPDRQQEQPALRLDEHRGDGDGQGDGGAEEQHLDDDGPHVARGAAPVLVVLALDEVFVGMWIGGCDHEGLQVGSERGRSARRLGTFRRVSRGEGEGVGGSRPR